jgi:hypothetical protein
MVFGLANLRLIGTGGLYPVPLTAGFARRPRKCVFSTWRPQPENASCGAAFAVQPGVQVRPRYLEVAGPLPPFRRGRILIKHLLCLGGAVDYQDQIVKQGHTFKNVRPWLRWIDRRLGFKCLQQTF